MSGIEILSAMARQIRIESMLIALDFEQLQQRAKEYGVDDTGTEQELANRLADHEIKMAEINYKAILNSLFKE